MILGDVGTHGGVVIDATNKNRIVRKRPAYRRNKERGQEGPRPPIGVHRKAAKLSLF